MSPVGGQGQNGGIVVPVLFAAVLVTLGVSLYRQQRSISRLDRTDRIACQFITEDAKVRRQEARNTLDVSVVAERRFVGYGVRLVKLFGPSIRKAKPAQRGGLVTFRDYLQAQISQDRQLVAVQQKNVVLTQGLAAKGDQLAAQLHC